MISACDQHDFAAQHIIGGHAVFQQCTPPEFSATLPPIEHAICDDGSGA